MNGTPEVDEMLDIEECFRPVAREHGRSMFALVMAAGMAGEAMQVLGKVLGNQHSTHGVHAAQVIGQCFNQLSNAYVTQMGWTEAQLVACDTAVKLAFQSRIVVPGSSSILQH